MYVIVDTRNGMFLRFTMLAALDCRVISASDATSFTTPEAAAHMAQWANDTIFPAGAYRATQRKEVQS